MQPTAVPLPGRAQLEEIFRLKYGDPSAAGWGPRRRWRSGYFNPDDHYEALLNGLVRPDTQWLDVGCGRDVFPNNPQLARLLAARCARLVGIDPAPTLADNPFVHERLAMSVDEYRGEVEFDLVTMRMVAEHVVDPPVVLERAAAALRPGGLLVVYTVNRFSPIPLLTNLVPFRLRHPIKRFLWRTEERDTFPTAFRMNSRRRLRRLAADAGLEEVAFSRLDDCRTLGRFKAGLGLELLVRTMLRAVALPYPEQCLLGVYRRRPGAGTRGGEPVLAGWAGPRVPDP